MPSPFPGMDPYLEAQPYWSDFHIAMIMAMKSELRQRLPQQYTVWADVYIWLHEPDAETRQGRPDVFVSSELASAGDGGLAVLPAPATAILPAIRREGNKYLKIRETRSDRVVTVIELLSPANKEPGEDHEAFLAKRNEYLATGANLVELDLLRSGARMPFGQPAPPDADYYALICRAAEFPKTGIWPISVRERLPELPIPLKPQDGFVTLPLQKCLDWAYDQGSYDRELDYTQPPRIPLKEADAVWARKMLTAGVAPR